MIVSVIVTKNGTITINNEQLVKRNFLYLSLIADAFSNACCENSTLKIYNMSCEISGFPAIFNQGQRFTEL